ncbi:MAG: tetratricopeptide repeat protein [Treponema sp.]|nr:tetratricopeptide repeat protein [Treponema sp.]
MAKHIAFLTLALFFATVSTSCTMHGTTTQSIEKEQQQLKALLKNETRNSGSRYAIVNQIANNMLTMHDYQSAILFLTDWVQKHPSDAYNSYWLLMTAYAYLSINAEPFAEYYFDRIFRQYPDLLVKGQSVHFLCLRNLIQISKVPSKRIKYFNEIINRFPSDVSTTELYLRRALEYEKDNDWEPALRSFALFLAQPDASTIQIAGEPNAYNEARQLVDFNNSSKDWTFETLESLERSVKSAIRNYDWRALDSYRAKINFFYMSWNQDATDPNSQQEFSMRLYMRGQPISYSDKLEMGTTPNEAYLRTRGWSQYAPVWYFYFRRVNFPIDQAIHSTWEWAGIYIGERL